ncbi:hypothetical protein VP01_1010g7 [Puccinia sorghi]|uniref:Uncharacterized protein n=1 Tax=Puccinia sorghi TaxID=27349 RepID=A0A0L6VVG4_9BASI|nr:hypothetical protein VP01_1010g7 [Puccinia sorghi]
MPRMMLFMDSSLDFQTPPPAAPLSQPVVADTCILKTSHHQKPPPVFHYQPPLALEFDHLAHFEPMKLKDLWLSRDSSQLLSFLFHIQDFLQLRGSLFQ